MPDSRENTVSVRIYESTQDELLDEQRRVKKTTGEKPSIADLVATTWEVYKGAVTPNTTTETRSTSASESEENFSNPLNVLTEITRTSDATVPPGELPKWYDALSELTQVVRAMQAQLARMDLRIVTITSEVAKGGKSEVIDAGAADVRSAEELLRNAAEDAHAVRVFLEGQPRPQGKTDQSNPGTGNKTGSGD